jgi:hypothetical protein
MSNASEIFSTPTVYKKTSTGKIQQWRAWVETTDNGFLLRGESGQTDGKLTETAGREINEGKQKRSAQEQSSRLTRNLARNVMKDTSIQSKTLGHELSCYLC